MESWSTTRLHGVESWWNVRIHFFYYMCSCFFVCLNIIYTDRECECYMLLSTLFFSPFFFFFLFFLFFFPLFLFPRYGAEGINDVNDFVELTNALKIMDFNEHEIDFMFRTAVAVLHLGNITFTSCSGDGTGCTVVSNGKSGESLMKAAESIGVGADELGQGLTVKVLITGKERTAVNLDDAKSRTVRDSLSKWLYNRMFNWLVARISSSMKPTIPETQCSYIGVLDIFGFEIFEHNSFEQLWCVV